MFRLNKSVLFAFDTIVIFLKKKAMHKKNICNQVPILNRNNLMEAISVRKAEPLRWIWSNEFIISFRPYTILGTYKKKSLWEASGIRPEVIVGSRSWQW